MSTSPAATLADFDRLRFNMIEQQIRPWEVLDQRVLDVLAGTPREDFVPEKYRSSLAFSDLSLPLAHDQVMLPPKVEGRMLQALNVRPNDNVLEIGTGSGYLTACLARLGGQVLSVDLFDDFIADAGQKLEGHEIRNFRLTNKDAATGWSAVDRYDVIAVTGSLPELHRGFHESLNPGGRLFVVTGKPPVMEALLITRISESQWAQESLFETSIPPLINAPEKPAFAF
jgi:protein-L-isoaspartate(D-aspartate) O-methyltransferase